MKIEYVKNPNPNDIDFLTVKINEETTKYGKAHPFAFFVRNNDKSIIAGANGFIIYGTIYTDQLWVAKKFRKQNYACKIMDEIHKLGKLQGCQTATIQTMDFQNVIGFYEKLGYTQDFKRKRQFIGHLLKLKKSVIVFFRITGEYYEHQRLSFSKYW